MKQNQTNQNVDFKSSTTVYFVPDTKPEVSKYGHVQKVIFYAKKWHWPPDYNCLLYPSQWKCYCSVSYNHSEMFKLSEKLNPLISHKYQHFSLLEQYTSMPLYFSKQSYTILLFLCKFYILIWASYPRYETIIITIDLLKIARWYHRQLWMVRVNGLTKSALM